MKTSISISLMSALILSGLSACSVVRPVVSVDVLRPYIPEVVQGNFVSREQKDMLKPGLSRQQVREVLGTPLVSSLFHADRWDYVLTIRRQGVAPQSFSLSLSFKNEVLERVSGDELPSEAEFVTKLVAVKTAPKQIELQAKEEDLLNFPAPVRQPSPAAPAAPLPSTYPPLEPAKP